MSKALGEFEQISQIMAPLAQKAKGAFSLQNDAAVLSHAANEEMVITTDTLVAGVHFFPDDPPESIAVKVLGVNLSDLAAMGATPLHYTLNTSYPSEITTDWIKRFATGLQKMQDQYGITLIGGDTTRTPGPATFSLSAIGTVQQGRALERLTTSPGDDIYVSGTIGDSALGLLAAQGKINDPNGFLLDRYRHPRPRTKLGQGLLGLATACLDISDGLLTDLSHFQAGASLCITDIPLSAAARELVSEDSSLWSSVLNGGDDYELLFTVSPQKEKELMDLSETSQTPVKKIGRITEGSERIVLDEEGQPLKLKTTGYRHF